MIRKREKWLDSFKGLGILFVVLGHCFPPQEGVTNYLYSFHIALFFFVSGYHLPKDIYLQSFSSFSQKRFKRLMYPYFVYGLITYLIWLLLGRNFGMNKVLDIPVLKPLLGLFYGNGFDNYLVFNIAIWFLPTLFSSLIIYYRLTRIFKNRVNLLLAVLTFLGIGYIDSIYGKIRLPWGINISFIAIFFIYLGQQGKVILEKLEKNKKWVNFIMAILVLLVGYYLQSLNSGVSFNSHSYGNIFYFIVSATFSILGYAVVTKIFLDNKLLQFLGVNSLRILALHILSFSLISAFLKYFLDIDYLIYKNSMAGRFCYFISSIVIVSLYSLSLDRIILKIKSKESKLTS